LVKLLWNSVAWFALNPQNCVSLSVGQRGLRLSLILALFLPVGRGNQASLPFWNSQKNRQGEGRREEGKAMFSMGLHSRIIQRILRERTG
jgi:hypothetical protein